VVMTDAAVAAIQGYWRERNACPGRNSASVLAETHISQLATEIVRLRSVLWLSASSFCKHDVPVHPPYNPDNELCVHCEARRALGV
jgi:hypothetical protein